MAMVPSIQDRYDLTPQQAAFVEHMLLGETPAKAAVSVGYCSENNASRDAPRLLRHPAIVLSLHAEVAKRLRTEGAAVGYYVLLGIARDESAAKHVRADCAKTLLALGGHTAPKAEPAAPGDKMLGEMNSTELLEVVKECESELAARATPVNPPNAPILEAQDTDIFD